MSPDKDLLDFLERHATKGCSWKHKSWGFRGDMPELLCLKVGAPLGGNRKTHATLREAIEAEKQADFWRNMERVAKEVEKWPAWKKGSPTNSRGTT